MNDDLLKDIKRFTEGPLRCDFCNRIMDKLDPKHVYQAKYKDAYAAQLIAYLRSGLEVEDSGEWAACDDCAELIERKDWEALEHRALAGALAESPTDLSVKNALLHIHFVFRVVFGVSYPLPTGQRGMAR